MGCNWNCELIQYLSNIYQIQFMAASALLKNTISTEEWMTATTFVK